MTTYESKEGKPNTDEPKCIAEQTTAPSAEMKPEGLLSGKTLLILILSYFTYQVLGGITFHFIEYSNEQTVAVSSRGKLAEFLGK